METKQVNESPFRQASTLIPIAMSLAALALIIGYVAIFGIVQHEDEGAPAHIFQLLMILQLPVVGYFAIKWLPKRPIQALIVLALQAVAWIIPIAIIIWLEGL